MTLKPFRVERQRQTQSCACTAHTLSPHRDISLLRAERWGATVGLQEVEQNEGGGGSTGNVFPALSGPSIDLKCKEIICDSFDMKWQPVALRCCWLWFPAPTILPRRGTNVRCLLPKAAFSPNRGYSSETHGHLMWLLFFSSFLSLAEVFLLWVRGPEKEHVWRLLA